MWLQFWQLHTWKPFSLKRNLRLVSLHMGQSISVKSSFLIGGNFKVIFLILIKLDKYCY